MSQTTSQDRLRAQIAAARQGLGGTVPPAAANDSAQSGALHHARTSSQPNLNFGFHRKKVLADATTIAKGTAGGAASTSLPWQHCRHGSSILRALLRFIGNIP